jgi:hypothetical protein
VLRLEASEPVARVVISSCIMISAVCLSFTGVAECNQELCIEL